MSDLLSSGEFEELFRHCKRSVFRIETRGVYAEPDEHEPLRRFLVGEEPDDAWLGPWLDAVENATLRGCQVQRVLMLTEPISDYLRFELDLALRQRIPAGERVRVISRLESLGFGIPEDVDFWMYDDEAVGLVHFQEGRTHGVELVTDPRKVERYAKWRDKAWELSLGHDEWEGLLR